MLIKVIKDSVIYNREIIEAGNDFECDDVIAVSLIERGYAEEVALGNEPTEENVEDANELPIEEGLEPQEVTQVDIETLKKDELVEMAESMGLETTGTKADLIKRILEFEEENELPNTEMPE